ncbi:MAG: polyprenyl synthetase family protein [Bacteroidia bacterium]|nr:polyprenyl synthetase family protein [Bacteroidia bacterium]MCX7652390.1 polyprenyl synthetase family protein [Bacteroidia bacterium]MDW8416933.1 polyprenyl synthetase family protein [Bacteroidia bacterium]
MIATTPSRISLTELYSALPEWREFEAFYAQTLRSAVYRNSWLLEKLGSFILRRGGKKVRPLLLLYTAKAAGQITPLSYVGGVLIELLHNATLVHDDVIDDSNYRRGFFSLRGLWGNRIAVLFGDWLLARGLLLSLKYKAPELLYYTSEAVEALTEGELLQLKRMRTGSVSIQEYFEVIEKKTAALFQAACCMGAWTAEASSAVIDTAAELGKTIGIAFQIRDDLLDWGDSACTGKPTDSDRQQKRFTLPLLWAFSQLSASEKRALLRLPFSDARRRLHDLGAFDYAESVLQTYAQRAHSLASDLPNSTAVPIHALLDMLIFRSQ